MQLIPLGGLGEIGLNAMLLESGGELVLVDCGLMFPGPDLLGVEIILPDLTYLKAHRHRLRGVVLTHGHEDHIGALPYVLPELNVPVFGTRFTLAMLRHRLDELGVRGQLETIDTGAPFRVGAAFTVEAFRVSHSIPDGIGLIVRTAEGTVVHTGDFKLDPSPLDGRRTDLDRLGEVGDQGVLALLSDSTNAEVEGDSGSEARVAATLERLVGAATGRVIVSMFASHLPRIQQVLALAARTGRKVALAGRAMHRNVQLGRELGLLGLPDDLLLPLEDTPGLPPERVLVLATGSQAEPRSALQYLATEASGSLGFGPGDLVMLSARTIPGYERPVGELIDRILARGARVAYPRVEPGIHVSGHAARGELSLLLDRVRPRNLVPIHGELRHLHSHRALALQRGLSTPQVTLARDGDVVALAPEGARLAGRVPVGRLLRSRFGGGEVTPEAIRDRALLGDTGVIFAAVVLSRATTRVLDGPRLEGRGLPTDEVAALPTVLEDARRFLEELSPELRRDEGRVQEELRAAVRRALKPHSDKRATVVPLVLWV